MRWAIYYRTIIRQHISPDKNLIATNHNGWVLRPTVNGGKVEYFASGKTRVCLKKTQNYWTTVELRSNGPKSNGNLIPTDSTFSPQTSHFFSMYWLKHILVIAGHFKFVRAKFYCIKKIWYRASHLANVPLGLTKITLNQNKMSRSRLNEIHGTSWHGLCHISVSPTGGDKEVAHRASDSKWRRKSHINKHFNRLSMQNSLNFNEKWQFITEVCWTHFFVGPLMFELAIGPVHLPQQLPNLPIFLFSILKSRNGLTGLVRSHLGLRKLIFLEIFAQRRIIIFSL